MTRANATGQNTSDCPIGQSSVQRQSLHISRCVSSADILESGKGTRHTSLTISIPNHRTLQAKTSQCFHTDSNFGQQKRPYS